MPKKLSPVFRYCKTAVLVLKENDSGWERSSVRHDLNISVCLLPSASQSETASSQSNLLEIFFVQYENFMISCHIYSSYVLYKNFFQIWFSTCSKTCPIIEVLVNFTYCNIYLTVYGAILLKYIRKVHELN